MVQDLLFELHRRRIKLRLVDGRLDVLAPSGSLTPELRDELRLRKDGLVALLRRTEAGEEPQAIVPRPDLRHEPFPLTDIQHAYWIGRHSAMELGGVSTHYYAEFERDGLDLPRLELSLRRVIERHDMLRAVVGSDGLQRILPQVPPYRIAVYDLRGASPRERDAEISLVRSSMAHQVLPADRWPLFEIGASVLDGGRTRLHVSLDMLIMDAVGLYQFFHDWRRYYEDPDWAPEPLELSYRDHVCAEEAARAGSRYQKAEAYWLDRLDELPPPPALPLAAQPAQLRHTEFVRRQARLPREQWRTLKRIAREHGLTPSTLLMAAFAEVLRLWTKQPGFTLNLTLFNRPMSHPQIDRIIGDFTSLTMIAVEPPADDSFTARARALQQQLMRNVEHASYSGVRVLRERARRGGAGPSASMPVVFTSGLVLVSEDDDDSMSFLGEEMCSISQTPQVWLDHQVMTERGELVYNWDAVGALFPAGLLDDMFASYRDLLDRLGRDDDVWNRTGPLVELPRWQAEERAAANDTAADIPARTLCELVESQARQRPDAIAVIAEDGRFTYREVTEQAHRLARRLVDLGARPNTLIGVVLEKSGEQFAAVLGVTGSGAAYLPIDPDWPRARRDQLLDQGGVRVVVTSAPLAERLAWPDGVHVVTFDDVEVREADPSPPAIGPSPDDLAYVIFTSGSTGRPKGVAIDHRGAANTVQDINDRFAVGPDDRVLALSALSFDLSVYDVFGTLAAGATAVVPSALATYDPRHWSELVELHEVTVWNSVPALMQLWVDACEWGGAAAGSRLRLAMLSGDWIPVELPDRIRGLYPDARVISLGGATEASIWSVWFPVDDVPEHWTRIPYGKPLANQALHVYDDRLNPCPVWTVGEIYIGGVGVAVGYWADPERTRERFITHPTTGERLYRTGDLGRYLPGGDIEFLGRQDFQVKLNGYRIELGEIAAALRRLPHVADALVTVDTNPRTENRQLVAYVVPSEVRETTAAPEDSTWWDALVLAAEAELVLGSARLAEDLEVYRQAWQATEDLCPPLMARTLARLGVFTASGEAATSEDIVRRCGVQPRYRGLVDHWLSALSEEDQLRPTGRPGEYRVDLPFDVTALDDQVEQALAALDAARRDLVVNDEGGVHRAVATYFADCADHQVELLRGEVDLRQFLVPGGSADVVEALYGGNSLSVVENSVVARVVRDFVDHAPDDRPVRLLEVGAGTGATSAHVLPELPADRVEYRLTDISTFFTERARAKFEEYPFVEHATFDIDRDPASQGVAPSSVDVIIAAQVLHNAADLDRTLDHLRSALAPGGLLVLIEGTVNRLAHLVTAGFVQDFSNYQDDRSFPLLPVAGWRDRLKTAGYARFAAIPDTDDAPALLDQHVLVAQAPTTVAGLSPEAMRDQLGEVLPDYMVPHHFLLIDRIPLSANGKVDRSALPTAWRDTTLGEPVAPRDELEQTLYEIWCEALERDDFGVEDNFFELGGDSLHAVRILGRLGDELGVRQTAEEGLQGLFQKPTIAGLAKSLRAMADR